MEEPVPLGPRGDYQPRYSGYMPFARVFDCVWGGRRHVMIGPIQIDRFGQTNLSGIGALERPKVQMLGMRGLPGNSISHLNSMFVPNHSPRVFVPGEVDIVGGVGYNAGALAGGGERDVTSTCASSSRICASWTSPVRTMRSACARSIPGVALAAGAGGNRLPARARAGPHDHRRADPRAARAHPPARSARPARPGHQGQSFRRAPAGPRVSDPLHTLLCERLGCRYPIIQTAMGWVARPELVGASCNAGAFGFLAAAVLRPDEVGPAIERVRALTAAPVRGELPHVPARRRAHRRDPHRTQGDRGQLRARAGQEDDRAFSRCRNRLRAHRRGGEAREEDGRARRRHAGGAGRRGRRSHRLGGEHGAAAAGARCRQGAGHRRRRLCRRPRAGRRAGLRRAGHRHGHALSDDPRVPGAAAHQGTLHARRHR